MVYVYLYMGVYNNIHIEEAWRAHFWRAIIKMMEIQMDCATEAEASSNWIFIKII